MLKTHRLCLRNLNPNDLDTLFKYRNDIRCNRYQRYEDTSREYLKRFIDEYTDSNLLSKEAEQHYAIECCVSHKMVGDVSVFFSESDNCFTLGITIAPIFQRQGYAFEILSELIARIQDIYPFMDIVAMIDKENFKSIALFKKLNFIEECYAEQIQSYVFTIYGKSA